MTVPGVSPLGPGGGGGGEVGDGKVPVSSTSSTSVGIF